jgi:hypothetical protein
MLEVFLTIVFVFILLYYGFRLFLRYGLPWLLTRHIRKQQQKFYGANDQTQENARKRKEGEVKIKNPGNDKKKKKDEEFGEYVDFEEVDE